jgi:hypothetical protein
MARMMLQRSAVALAAMASAILHAGCDKPSAGGSTSGTASVSAASSPADLCRAEVGAFAKGYAGRHSGQAKGEKKAELEQAVEAAVLGTCETERWDASLRDCFFKLPADDTCFIKAEDSAHGKLRANVKAAQRKVLGEAFTDPDLPPPLASATNARGHAFALGERLAFLAVERGMKGPTAASETAHKEAQTHAKSLGVAFPTLPPPDKELGSPLALWGIDLIIASRAVQPAIEAKAGRDAALAFQLGMNAELVRRAVRERAAGNLDTVQTTLFALGHDSGQLKLPPELAKTLIDVVEGGAEPDAVDAASRVFVLAVSQLLAAPPRAKP